jgi:hypothetical protein
MSMRVTHRLSCLALVTVAAGAILLVRIPPALAVEWASSGPYPSVAEIRQRFRDPQQVRVFEWAPFVVITDVPRLNGDAVTAAMHRMWRQTRDDFPGLPVPTQPVYLLIFATAAEYRAFWGAETHGALPEFDRSLASSAGVTVNGVASAWFDDRDGPVRPTYIHEASHALVHQVLNIPGGWLDEAIAERYALDVSWQWVPSLVQYKLAHPSEIAPLEQLLNGQRVANEQYWQALLVWQWMLADARLRVRVPGLLDAMRHQGSTDVRPLVQKDLGMTMDGLERAWLAWLRAKYEPAEPTPTPVRLAPGSVPLVRVGPCWVPVSVVPHHLEGE